MVMLAVMDRS